MKQQAYKRIQLALAALQRATSLLFMVKNKKERGTEMYSC